MVCLKALRPEDVAEEPSLKVPALQREDARDRGKGLDVRPAEFTAQQH